MTDKKGEFYEHTEYTSSGESWVNEKETGNANLPYKYTSKEQDAETGLYYYGARYYDARTSRWISCDPILESYLSGKPSGGVYNPVNMNLYAYCANNPIKYIDTDGNHFEYYASIHECFDGDRNFLQRRALVATYTDGGKTYIKHEPNGANGFGFSNTAGTSKENMSISVLTRKDDQLFLLTVTQTDTIQPDEKYPNRVMHYVMKPVNDNGEVDMNEKKWIKGTIQFTDAKKDRASMGNVDKLNIITGYEESGNKEGRSNEDTPEFVKNWKHVGNPNYTGKSALDNDSTNYRIKQDTNDGGKYYDTPKK